MTKLRFSIHKVNAWQIRIVALAFLVLGIGSGSQFLVNAFAAGTQSEIETAQTTTLILDTSSVRHAHSNIHIHIRLAGVDSLGGYTVTGKR